VTVKNIEASVHARLQNHARATKRPFQELLQYFAMERFLYRLSKSPHRSRFVLKGALMLHVWDAPLARATKDVDFLGRLDNSLEHPQRVVREVCAADVEPDGMVFEPATVRTERIKEDADYEGVRVRFVGLLGRARVTMQVDVGFGDVVTPGEESISYPALLDFPAPELSGYPRETVVAEKFQAMVLGQASIWRRSRSPPTSPSSRRRWRSGPRSATGSRTRNVQRSSRRSRRSSPSSYSRSLSRAPLARPSSCAGRRAVRGPRTRSPHVGNASAWLVIDELTKQRYFPGSSSFGASAAAAVQTTPDRQSQ
jgi:hypothetical protein